MDKEKVIEFLAQVQLLCERYGAHCDVMTKNRPHLEFAEIKITAKVVDNSTKAS